MCHLASRLNDLFFSFFDSITVYICRHLILIITCIDRSVLFHLFFDSFHLSPNRPTQALYGHLNFLQMANILLLEDKTERLVTHFYIKEIMKSSDSSHQLY